MSAAWVGKDKIYMGFMGSMEEPSIDILVYNLEYELIEKINLSDTMIMISSMVLTPDEKYLVCAHLQVRISIINTETFKVVSDEPFGDDDVDGLSIWRVAVTETGKLVFATTDGLFTGKINDAGEFDGDDHILFGKDCQRCQVVHGEFVMCAVQDADGSKLLLICLDDMDSSEIVKFDG